MIELAQRMMRELVGGEPDPDELKRVVARLEQLARGQERLRGLNIAGEEPVVQFSVERGS